MTYFQAGKRENKPIFLIETLAKTAVFAIEILYTIHNVILHLRILMLNFYAT